jgi:hypothetical protein
MKIIICDVKARKLIKAWEGHISSDTCCGSCAKSTSKCPINRFFKDMKKQLGKEI